MSHIVQIKTELRDPIAISAACKRLGLQQPTTGKFRVYAVDREGIGINLPGWQFPVVVNTTTGAVDYDNYNGSWGAQKELDAFLQAYAVEKAIYEAQKGGYSVFEETLPDGSIKLNIMVEA
jgi:hypothetical protein